MSTRAARELVFARELAHHQPWFTGCTAVSIEPQRCVTIRRGFDPQATERPA